MPVYNGKKHLKEAIASILLQDYKNFELITIDDASKDNSSEIIKQFNDNRIVLLTNPQNMGLASTLNIGIQNSKGEFIARMDQDDIALPNRLTLQLEAFHKDSDLGLCGSAFRIFGGGNHIIIKNPENYEVIRANLLFYNCIAHPTIMFKRRLFADADLSYDKNYDWAEDFELWTRAKDLIKMKNLPVPLLNYRMNQTSMTASGSSRVHESVKRINKRSLEEIGIFPSNELLDIHLALGHHLIDSKNLTTVNVVHEHLLNIINKNLEFNAYDSEILNSVISIFWRSIVYNIPRNQQKPYFHSPLTAYLGLRNVLKLQSIKKSFRESLPFIGRR